jgi:hypothetical protein
LLEREARLPSVEPVRSVIVWVLREPVISVPAVWIDPDPAAEANEWKVPLFPFFALRSTD